MNGAVVRDRRRLVRSARCARWADGAAAACGRGRRRARARLHRGVRVLAPGVPSGNGCVTSRPGWGRLYGNCTCTQKATLGAVKRLHEMVGKMRSPGPDAAPRSLLPRQTVALAALAVQVHD